MFAKKRRIAAALFLALSLTSCAPSPAAPDGDGLVSDLWVLDPAAFSQVMGTDKATAGDGTIPGAVRYEYTMQPAEDGSAEVTLTASCTVDQQTLELAVEGTVESLPYGAQDRFYEGELVGETVIRGIEYTISAGFQTLESTDDNARVGLVLTPRTEDAPTLMLTFGEPVLSFEEYEKLTQG